MKFIPHHVAISVTNLEESVKWYREKLGFEVTDHYQKDAMEITLIKLDATRIELFNFKNKMETLPEASKEVISDLHVVGTKHICIEVDDLDSLIADLHSKGVETARETGTTFFGGRSTFIKDCDDILIELYQQ